MEMECFITMTRSSASGGRSGLTSSNYNQSVTSPFFKDMLYALEILLSDHTTTRSRNTRLMLHMLSLSLNDFT